MRKAIKITLIVVTAVLLMAVALGIYIACTFEFGELGESVYYAYNPKTRAVVIYGDGTMPDYGYPDVNYGFDFWDPEENKWSSQLTFQTHGEVEYIVFMNGVTQISQSFIEQVDTLKAIYIPESVEYIHMNAFVGIDKIESIHFQGSPVVYDEEYAQYWAEFEYPYPIWHTWYTFRLMFGEHEIYYGDENTGWMEHDAWKLVEEYCTYIRQGYHIPWFAILFGHE